MVLLRYVGIIERQKVLVKAIYLDLVKISIRKKKAIKPNAKKITGERTKTYLKVISLSKVFITLYKKRTACGNNSLEKPNCREGYLIES